MNKVYAIILVVGVAIAAFSLGALIGYEKCNKDYEDYLPVVYGRGEAEVLEGITNMAKFYPELFQSLGNKEISYPSVVTYTLDYLDGTVHKIMWAKNVNGHLVIDRAQTYDEVPVN